MDYGIARARGQQPDTRLLIVEDDLDIAQGLSIVLSQLYQVKVRRCAWDAVESCGLEPPDLLLVDYRLPDMDGLRLVESIRRDWQHDLPAIMMSAYHDRREACLQAGIDAFIPKPFPPAQLIWSIERALANPDAI